jgi:hypothetical protein
MHIHNTKICIICTQYNKNDEKFELNDDYDDAGVENPLKRIKNRKLL